MPLFRIIIIAVERDVEKLKSACQIAKKVLKDARFSRDILILASEVFL